MDARIERYVAEVSKPGIPYVNSSHGMLADLYYIHGRSVIDQLLAAHWTQQRKQPKVPSRHSSD